MIEIIKTGIYLNEDELLELTMCNFNPTSLMYGPKEKKEPYEILQEIAKRYGLPELSDMYGLDKNEIICRNLPENKKSLKKFLNQS